MLDLFQNPFNLLRISDRAPAEEIRHAVEVSILEAAASEDKVREALRTLMAPRPRLMAELSWFPGCSSAQADQVLTALRRGVSVDSVLDLLKSVNGIARANLATHLCNHKIVDGNVMRALMASQKAMVPEFALPLINETRMKAGFPKASEELVREALAQLRSEHCEAACNVVVSRPHPGKAMTSVVEAFKDAEGPVAELLDMVADRYDAWSFPTLSRISDDLDELCRMLRENPKSSFEIGEIQEKLRLWDEYSQPLQLLYESKGLDEKRSLAIYEKLRGLCIWLANEKEEYEKALAISRALHETFPELPTVLAEVEQDMETLEDLISHARADEALQGLVAIIEQIVASPSGFSVSMERRDFMGGRQRTVAGRLHDEFLSAVDATSGTSKSEVPWMMVRSLAIRLHNNFGCSGAALQLLRALYEIRTAPPATPHIRDLLKADIAQAQRNVLSKKLNAAIEKQELDGALILIEQLLSFTTDAKERGELSRVKARVQAAIQRRSAQQRGWLVGLGAIAVVVIIALFSAAISGSGTSSRTYSSSTSRANTSRSTYSAPRSTHQQPNRTQSVDTGQRSSVLELQIAAGKQNLRNLESDLESTRGELEDLQAKLEGYESDIESYKTQVRLGTLVNTSGFENALDSYNLLVPKYNSLLEEAQRQYDDYKTELARVNRLISEYNSLIGQGSNSSSWPSGASGTQTPAKRSTEASAPRSSETDPVTAPGEHEPARQEISMPVYSGERLTYTVRAGDTLSKIAGHYGIPTERLLAFNTSIDSPNQIFVGQEIIVPGADEKAPERVPVAQLEKVRGPSSTPSDDESRERNPRDTAAGRIAANADSAETFVVGTHKDDVLRIQGKPDDISKYPSTGRETWFYGKSTVVFDSNEGRVTELNNADGSLKVTIKSERSSEGTSHFPNDSRTTGASHFTIGSHKDDVVRLQGTPDEIAKYESSGEELWSYGLSTISFDRGGLVRQWDNCDENLKVVLTPGSRTTGATHFTIGSHKDDVVRLQGTPDDIARYESSGEELWSYGLSTISFNRGGLVKEWDNCDRNLKVR